MKKLEIDDKNQLSFEVSSLSKNGSICGTDL